MRTERAFAAESRSVPAARKFATAALGTSSDAVRQAVELMVSELATNAIRHVRSPFEVVVEVGAARIRVEVTDHGGGVPTMRCPGPEEPTGRGLRIVDMFSDAWGIDPQGSGKTVWFELSPASAAGDQLLGRVAQ